MSSRIMAGGPRRRPNRRIILFTSAFAGIALTAVILILVLSHGNSGPTGSVNMNGDRIYDGVYVGNVPLGGLTGAEAKAKIVAMQEEFAKNTGVTVVKDEMKVLYTISELPHTFDPDATAVEALAQGRTGTEAKRRAAIEQLKTQPVRLTPHVTVDTAPLEEKIRELTEPYNVEAVNAKYAGYDASMPEGRRLQFTSDTQGSRVDTDALWAAVKKEFDKRTYGTVEMAVVTVDAKIKLSDLQGNLKLIGKCDTYLSKHKPERYTNIKLASQAISGLILPPGETFSFNDTTGERTVEKGYMNAPIDNQGVEDVGIGGGICQVSGTLFNAAMRAGLTMVERHHHSVPSAYLKKGKDATVDYGRYDLKLKNDYDKPVLIIIHYGTGAGKDQYTLYAEIYGPAFAEGIKGYDLEAQLDHEIPAEEGLRYVSTRSSLLPGETKVIDAHKGYVIKVFKSTILSDGTEKLSEEPLYVDTYDADCQVVVYYYEDQKPTGLPTETPEATPEPTAAQPSTQEPTQKPTPQPTPEPTPEGTPEGAPAG